MSIEVNDPDIGDLLAAAIENARGPIKTGQPGLLLSYDKTTQTAVVQPLITVYSVDYENEFEGYTRLKPVNVPVATVGGLDCSLAFPLKPGTQGWLTFCDRDTSGWESSGNLVDPPTRIRFSERYAAFHPGVRSPADPLDEKFVDDDHIVLGMDDEDMALKVADNTADKTLALATTLVEALNTAVQTLNEQIHDIPAMQVVIGPPGSVSPVLPSAPPAGATQAFADNLQALKDAIAALAEDPANTTLQANVTTATAALGGISLLNTSTPATQLPEFNLEEIQSVRILVDK